MKIECPNGWTSVETLSLPAATFTVHRNQVTLHAGICDSCDLCGITQCRFYDTSREATRLFLSAQAHEHTLEFLLQQARPN